jgi:hypothetical protein
MIWRTPRSAFVLSALCVAVYLGGPIASADDAPASPEQITRWVDRLASEDFTARRAAADELVRLGSDAVDAVAAAIRDGDRETTLSGFEVLSRILQSGDDDARTRVTNALQSLTESKDAAVVQRARQLLDQPEDVDKLRAQNRGFAGFPIQIQFRQGGNGVPFDQNGKRQVRAAEDGKKIEIDETRGEEIVVRVTETVAGQEQTKEVKARNLAELRQKDPDAFLHYRRHVLQAGGPQPGNVQAFAFGAANQKQITVTNVNGERTIQAKENGRQVEITDRDGKNITVRVEEEVNGKQQTNEYKAADLDELKQKHPDAAKLYEEYSRQAPGIQVQAVFNAFPAFQAPAAANGVQQANQSIERALGDLAEVRKQLEDLKAKDNADQEALDRLAARINAAEKSLFEAQARLGR